METKNCTTPVGYQNIKDRKKTGAHYTPTKLSDFLAMQIVNVLDSTNENSLCIADPAIGDGELLFSLASLLPINNNITAYGFDIDASAISASKEKLKKLKNVDSVIKHQDFIEYVISQTANNLFQTHVPILYDAVIANPPYVRTQVLGAKKSQQLSIEFNLKGRVDLYHAFLLGISKLLKPGGILGIIVSNRFMTTKSGKDVRKNITEYFDIIHIWDFGDTKLFEAAVLPAVLLLKKKKFLRDSVEKPKFTSIYSTKDTGDGRKTNSFFEAVALEGIVSVAENGSFKVQQGFLDTNGVWKMSNHEIDNWIEKVNKHTYMRFSDVGKIRVGVKTTADNVFIRSDWDDYGSVELLKKLTTHKVAKRYKPAEVGYKYILYPHETVAGARRSVDIDKYPNSKKYLHQYKEQLEKREYVANAGRKWYEIWVPHDPTLWSEPKIVFRDISEKPTFWLDTEGTVVNGDCYWLVSQHHNKDILWLVLAVANSTFIEAYYDHRFNNKLYSGRRRYITQYVEDFPLPDPESAKSHEIIELVKSIYKLIPHEDTQALENHVDTLIWESFGLR